MKILSTLLLLASLAHSESATIAFVGDVNFTGRIGEQMAVSGTTWPFEKVKDILAKADYRICNLESPVGVGGEKYCEKRVYFKANPQYLDALTDAGFNMVSLANNHALDYGPTILAQTQDGLAQRGILHTGIVANSSSENKPVIKEIKGIKFGFLAYCNACPQEFAPRSNTAGVAAGWSSRVVSEIKKLRPLVDFIIVMPHWGDEYHGYNKNQSDLTKKALKAGADVIVGHHPHVLQKIEQRGNSLIAYSLGNFLFPMRWNVSLDSAMLFIELIKEGDRKHVTASWTFVSLDSNRPVPIDANSERFKRDKYTIENGYDYPENRRWPEIGPWSKNGKAN